MTTRATLARSLRRIEAGLAALDTDAPEQPVDRHELRMLKIQLGAQCEMLEQGLVE